MRPFVPHERRAVACSRTGTLRVRLFGLRLGPSAPRRETTEGDRVVRLVRLRSSLRRPGRSGIMECLLPVSALRSAIYSTMTDRHRMDRRVSMPSPATSQAARSCGASTNEAVQETQWPKFSCEPWPPTGEERAPLKKKTAGFWFQDLNTAITR